MGEKFGLIKNFNLDHYAKNYIIITRSKRKQFVVKMILFTGGKKVRCMGFLMFHFATEFLMINVAFNDLLTIYLIFF